MAHYGHSWPVKTQKGLSKTMKEVYWEIKINKPGPRFLPELSLSGPAKVVYFDLPIYFLHGLATSPFYLLFSSKCYSVLKHAAQVCQM